MIRSNSRLEACDFEDDVLAAVVQSHWSPELRAHAVACPVCADVVTVAVAMEGFREETRAAAVLPDSSRVWYLAQARARREAARAAGRPITAAQVIAFACAMGLFGACFGATSAWFQALVRRVMAAPMVVDHGTLLVATAGLLLLIPAAACVVALRD